MDSKPASRAGKAYKFVRRNMGILATIVAILTAYFAWVDRLSPARLEIRQPIAVNLLAPIAKGLPIRLDWDANSTLGSPDWIPLHHFNLTALEFRNSGEQPLRWPEDVPHAITLQTQGGGQILDSLVKTPCVLCCVARVLPG